jgi:hypothetical protein
VAKNASWGLSARTGLTRQLKAVEISRDSFVASLSDGIKGGQKVADALMRIGNRDDWQQCVAVCHFKCDGLFKELAFNGDAIGAKWGELQDQPRWIELARWQSVLIGNEQSRDFVRTTFACGANDAQHAVEKFYPSCRTG